MEDEDPLRAGIETALYKAGFMVLSVADGFKAVEVFEARADDIGVVVLDCALPGLTGPAVFRHIRSVKPEMRVIFTSSRDPQDYRSGPCPGSQIPHFFRNRTDSLIC